MKTGEVTLRLDISKSYICNQKFFLRGLALFYIDSNVTLLEMLF